MVGANIGARQNRRALRIAMTGGALAFAATEAIGLAAAIWPEAWLTLFGADRTMVATGKGYLRFVGPMYGFFGLGLALYFASQGAGKLLWPLLAGFARLTIAAGGGWLMLRATGSVTLVFAMLGVALATYGAIVGIAIWSGVWFRKSEVGFRRRPA
jgi:Na+-driven multidrug efflux pump